MRSITRHPPRPNPIGPPPRAESGGRRWARRIVAIILLLLATLGMAVSSGMLFGLSTVDERVDRLAETLGVEISVGHVDLGLGRPTVAHRITVNVPQGPTAAIRKVSANLDLAALARGQRRPEKVTIHGLHARLKIGRKGVEGLAPVLDRWAKRRRGRDPVDSPKATKNSVALHLVDSAMVIEVTDPAVPDFSIRLDALSGTLSRTPETLAISGEARFQWAGEQHVGTLQASFEKGALVKAKALLRSPLTIPVSVKGKRYLATMTGVAIDREGGETRITGLALTDGVSSAQAETLVIRDSATGETLPSIRALSTVTVTKGKIAAVRGDGNAAAASMQLQLRWVDGEMWPVIERLAVSEARVEMPKRGVLASVQAASVGFAGPFDPTKVRDLETLANAVKSVSLTAPTATVTAAKGQWAALLPARFRRLLSGQEGDVAALPAIRPTASPSTPGAEPRARMRRLVRLLRRLPVAIEDGLVAFKERGVGPVMTLDNVGLTLKPGEGDTLAIEAVAMMVRQGQPTGQVSVSTRLDDNGQPTMAKGTVAGQDFAHLASRFSTYVAVPPTADLELAFAWTPPSPERPTHRLEGSAKLKNFGFEAWRIAHVPIVGIKGGVDYAVDYDPQKRRVILDLPKVKLGKATMSAKFDFTAARKDSKPKLSARLAMAKQDCADVRASIPAALLPRLKGLKVKGSMWFDAALDVDMDQPKKLTLDVKGSMESCQVLTLGEIDLNALKGNFVHHPVEPKKGVRKDLPVGRGTKEWVPSRRLPRHVKAAAIVTEDRSWRGHRGIRWTLVRRALKLNLKHGRFVYGGSTITQQLVKNLYLTREKALSRKLEEAIIAMHMERVLTKDEILTIYVNVVEFGPDIYGVKRAARFYFGKRPKHLSPLEAAFIMGLKPWPRGGYKQWSNGRVNAYWVKRLEHILSMMHRIEGAIDPEQIEEAAPFQPNFRPRGASFSWGTPYRRP